MPNQFFSPEGDLENYFVTEYWLIDQYVGDALWTWGMNSTNTLTNAGQLGIGQGFGVSLTPVTTSAGGTNWKQVSCGGYHKAAIKTDGTLWTWGTNASGFANNLGINLRSSDIFTPVTTFAGGTNWKQVSGGDSHTAAIKTDGTLWTWGYGSNGILGNASTTDRSTPVTTFSGGTNWKQVSAGYQYTAAIKTDGTLWTWGLGTSGRLGNASTTNRSTPVTTFAGGTNWKQVSAGNGRTAAIKTDGTLWTWGYAYTGGLGNAQITNKSTPVTTFAGGTNWKQVSCGLLHTAAIKTDGTLWTWGFSNSGILGNAVTTGIIISTPITTFAGGTNWKQVSTGQNHIAAIKTDGTLWTWGNNGDGGDPNRSGGLGTNNTITRSTPGTTFAGGTNWKQVGVSIWGSSAVQAGTSADLPFS
jgi:alpha-tubulin suppressor-like RCC1 family protein